MYTGGSLQNMHF